MKKIKEFLNSLMFKAIWYLGNFLGSLNKNTVNRVEKIVDKHLKNNTVAEIDKDLEKIPYKKLTAREKEDWHYYCGIAAYRRDDKKLALERYKTGYENFPNSPRIGFALGQPYENEGNIEKAFELFDKFKDNQTDSMYTSAQARYAYLWNDYSRAIEYLNPIMNLYFSIKNIDDTFIYAHGLPFFKTTINSLSVYYILAGKMDELKILLDKCYKNLFNFYGFDKELQTLIKAIENQDFSEVIQDLENKISDTKNVDPEEFINYYKARLAILKSQALPKYEDAINLLDSVKLSNENLKWQSNMLILAKANISKKFNMTNEEENYKKDFFQNEPLLLDPYYALEANLFQYQENLKTLYKNAKFS